MGLYCTEEHSTNPSYTKAPERYIKYAEHTPKSSVLLQLRSPPPAATMTTPGNKTKSKRPRAQSTCHRRRAAPNIGNAAIAKATEPPPRLIEPSERESAAAPPTVAEEDGVQHDHQRGQPRRQSIHGRSPRRSDHSTEKFGSGTQ